MKINQVCHGEPNCGLLLTVVKISGHSIWLDKLVWTKSQRLIFMVYTMHFYFCPCILIPVEWLEGFLYSSIMDYVRLYLYINVICEYGLDWAGFFSFFFTKVKGISHWSVWVTFGVWGELTLAVNENEKCLHKYSLYFCKYILNSTHINKYNQVNKRVNI